MESIEKLRGLNTFGSVKVDGDLIATNMLMACATMGEINEIADEIEREIAERFAELPVDADGVPIHVGDSIEYPNGTHDVVRFITVNDNVPTFNESGWVASKCRHVKPRTVEDVLNDFASEAYDVDGRDDEEWLPLLAKYAAELQMRGDAE